MSGRLDPSEWYSGAINEGTEHRYNGDGLAPGAASRIAGEILDEASRLGRQSPPPAGEHGWGERHFVKPGDPPSRRHTGGIPPAYGDPRR